MPSCRVVKPAVSPPAATARRRLVLSSRAYQAELLAEAFTERACSGFSLGHRDTRVVRPHRGVQNYAVSGVEGIKGFSDGSFALA